MRAKRKKPKTTPHIWIVKVRHRDFLATANDEAKRLWMKTSNLWIICRQRPIERPSIDMAIVRARRYLSRHQRLFGLSNIEAVKYRGTIDETT